MTERFGIFIIIISFATCIKYQKVTLNKPYTIKLAASLPISGNIFPLGKMCLEPAKLAVEMTNNRSDILPDYNIVLDVIDDQCDAAVGLNRIVGPVFLNKNPVDNQTFGQYQFPETFHFIQHSATTFYMPPIVTGSVCSGVCQVLANLMESFNTIQVCSNSSYQFLYIKYSDAARKNYILFSKICFFTKFYFRFSTQVLVAIPLPWMMNSVIQIPTERGALPNLPMPLSAFQVR